MLMPSYLSSPHVDGAQGRGELITTLDGSSSRLWVLARRQMGGLGVDNAVPLQVTAVGDGLCSVLTNFS